MKSLPSVALGTWSWGTGFAGGDTVFGNHLSDTQMADVFTTAMSKGLNLWTRHRDQSGYTRRLGKTDGVNPVRDRLS